MMNSESFPENFWGKLSLAKYLFIIKAKEDIFLPPYKGSVLRGGFGNAFRKICCVNKNEEDCDNCLLKEKCVYAYTFDTSPPSDSKYLKKTKEVPRPFVIEPPLEEKSNYKKDEFLEFSLILIGKAIEYLPYFIFTFKELGKIGIGKRRGKFELYKVFDFNKEEIYNLEDEVLKNTDSQIDFDKIINSISIDSNYLSLNFLTPTRIKFKGDLVVLPEFHILLRALLHRLSALSYFHCQRELTLDYKSLISQAEKIKIKEEDLRWYDWERYSSRQDARMKLGGFMGRIIYEGDFSPFLPLIVVGQYTHIGKNCTFGLGKYEIVQN